MPRPNATDFSEYFARYINLVQENEIQLALEKQQPILEMFLQSITEEKSMYSYAPGKWTIKEMLQHLIDAERVFTYRAMCIARKETVALPSFDENNYADNSNANARSWAALCEECLNLRRSSINLIESFTEEMLVRKGNSAGKTINVSSLVFIIIGHYYHHMKVVEERYMQVQV